MVDYNKKMIYTLGLMADVGDDEILKLIEVLGKSRAGAEELWLWNEFRNAVGLAEYNAMHVNELKTTARRSGSRSG